ncbi:MAG: sugar ABC transporter permease [Lachnospiraceae bacterium]
MTVHKPKKLKGRYLWPYLFILPFFVIYIAFNCYPLIYTFFISLHDWDGFTEPVMIGFGNYKNIFTEDPYFLKAIGNTLIFMMFDIPIVILGGLLLASVFNSRKLKGANFFRTAAFLPYITIPVAIGVLFSLLFDWNSGAVNELLMKAGIIKEHINFLGTPSLARMIVVLMICWKYIGYHMIFFNAGISGISRELYEAADVDGASGAAKFTKITVPLLKPIIEYLVIMNIIWGFQLFDEPKVLFSSWSSSTGASALVGGPLKSCLTAIWYIYDTSFGSQMRYGKGAAAAYGTFLFILVFSMAAFIVMKIIGRKDRDGR